MLTSHDSPTSTITTVRPARTEDGLGAGPVAAGARLPLRLLMSSSVGRGAMDGAWWPQSRDLQIELADLVDHFPKEIGQIGHAVYSTPDWLPAPRRIKVARGFIKADSFPRDDTHLILLRTPGGEFLRVMVVPPASTPDVAHSAMKIAATPTNLDSAGAILVGAGQRETAVAAAGWDDDGGA